jgi:S-adenosylmethionine decarboxylase
MGCTLAWGSFQGVLYGSDEHQFKGKHFVASYLDCDDEAIRDVQALKEALIKAARASHATIIGQTDFVFEPDGLTMVILLSESHASIHTYPEHHACFVDLFTCGDNCSSEEFDQILRAFLKPGKVNAAELLRSDTIELKSNPQ